MGLLLFYLFIALFTSFLCSIMEAVLLSTPVSYLKSQIEMGNQGAELLLKQKEEIDKPLSAILSLNTMAHTIGAAGVGAQAVVVFGEAYFGLVTALLTIMILVLTEIIPKSLGANYSKQLVGISGKIIKGMVFIAYPLVLISGFITKRLANSKHELTTSREEISALTSIGTEEGIFGEKENKIIQNLIRLKNIRVDQVMTPRVVVLTANEELTLKEFMENKEFITFSRIPVYKKNKDNITGYVFRSAVLEKLAEDKFKLKLKDIKREILTFQKTTTLFNALDVMTTQREHISLIVDEYGGMDGITTLEDIIESLLGIEIIDEKDIVADMQEYAIEQWKLKRRRYESAEVQDSETNNDNQN